jgi:hypothetical protein
MYMRGLWPSEARYMRGLRASPARYMSGLRPSPARLEEVKAQPTLVHEAEGFSPKIHMRIGDQPILVQWGFARFMREFSASQAL